MADNNAKYDLMYAYALGCLGEDEVLDFKEMIVSNENFQWDELSEFQNLTALMASILSVEIPMPEVKERVAQKLYNLKDENMQLVQQDEETNPVDQIFGSILFKEEEEINIKDTKGNTVFEESVPDNAISSKSLEEPLFEEESKLEQSSDEKPEIEIQNENLNEEISSKNEIQNDETQGIEIHSESEPEEEVYIDNIKNNIEQTIEENKSIDKNNNPPYELDDFLPKRKEPEKFRLEEVDEESQRKMSQNFIEKFIEHNKSSITEKIDKTIGGVKEQIGNEPEVDESGYELVQPLSKNLSIFSSYNFDEKKDVLDENLIDHQLGEDSLKSQELQRVFIKKNSGSKLSVIILTILSILFLGAAIYFYLNFQKFMDNSNKQITQLKNDSAALISSKQTSRAVISFLESPNVKVIELGPTDAAPNSSGKLYINFAAGTGYLYTQNLPVLPSDKSLQLWLTDGSRFISLGVVATKSDDEYYPFAFNLSSSPESTEVLVTEENSGGAKQPGNKLILIGALN